MKHIIIGTILCALLAPVSVSAHETKTIGSLSVLLHMEPQDSPVVGEEAKLYFAFTDANEKFNLAQCECVFEITKGKNTLNRNTLMSADALFGLNVALANFTFPNKGIYMVSLEGSARDGSFESFAISYGVRIERENTEESPVDPLVQSWGRNFTLAHLIYGAGGIFALIIIIIGFYPKSKRRY